MIYKPTYIKCVNCNVFYKYKHFFHSDIVDMKKGKLIKCNNCKNQKYCKIYSVFQEDLQ